MSLASFLTPVRSRCSMIGLDITPRAIRAAQLNPGTSSSPPRLLASAVVPRPPSAPAWPDADEMERLGAALERRGLKGPDAVLAVPEGRVLSAPLDLPPRSSGAPLDFIAKSELARLNKRDPSRLELAMWDLPPAPRSAPNQTCVMAVACDHDDAQPPIDAAAHAGLEAVALDLRPLALLRAVRPLAAPGASEGVAVLDIGWSGCTFLVGRAGALYYERTMRDAGLGSLLAILTAAVKAEPAVVEFILAQTLAGQSAGDVEASRSVAVAIRAIAAHVASIADEVATAYAYSAQRFAQSAHSAVLLTGEGAGLPGLAEALTARLSVPVKPALPRDIVACGPDQMDAAADPALMAAIGLAMHSFAALRSASVGSGGGAA